MVCTFSVKTSPPKTNSPSVLRYMSFSAGCRGNSPSLDANVNNNQNLLMQVCIYPSVKQLWIPMWKSKISSESVAKTPVRQLRWLSLSLSCGYSGLHAEQINSQKRSENLHNLAVSNSPLTFFSRRDSWYVYSSGPWSQMEVFTTRGQTMHSWRQTKVAKRLKVWSFKQFLRQKFNFNQYYISKCKLKSKVSAMFRDYNDIKA